MYLLMDGLTEISRQENAIVYDAAQKIWRTEAVLYADAAQSWHVIQINDAVSPRQIRQALTQVGLRPAVEAAIAAGDQNLQDWWAYSTSFERHHPLVANMASALDVSPDQLDNLWLLAGTL